MTMLATSVRVRPCSDRLLALVVGAGHLEGAVVAAVDRRSARRRCAQSVPLGPLTVTVLAVDGDVDAGRDRDREACRCATCAVSSWSRLPDVGEDFPTHALLVGLPVGQQARRRRDDRDAQAAEHLGRPVRLA